MSRKFELNNIGLLTPSLYEQSPFCDERPEGEDISLIVIHNISLPPKSFGGPYIQDFFKGDLDSRVHDYFIDIHSMKVSSHLLVRRNGFIIQFVPLSKRAWHAGKSEYNGRSNCNDFSIGIELEGTDDIKYSEAQYQSLVGIITSVLNKYPKTDLSSIVGHQDIAPGRKTDPGRSFNWEYLRRLMRSKEST